MPNFTRDAIIRSFLDLLNEKPVNHITILLAGGFYMFEDNMSRYADIINLPRPRSNHKPMSMHDRAAQFSPFSALTGLDDELAETARIVDSKIEISEDRAADLDEKIQFLIENASEHLEIEVEYFVPDKLKEGGAYKTVKGCFKRVDDETHNVILMDGTVILIFYHINIIFAIKIIILSFPKIQPRHIGIRKKRQLTIANRQRKEPSNAGFNRLQDLENTVRNSIIDKIGYAE